MQRTALGILSGLAFIALPYFATMLFLEPRDPGYQNHFLGLQPRYSFTLLIILPFVQGACAAFLTSRAGEPQKRYV